VGLSPIFVGRSVAWRLHLSPGDAVAADTTGDWQITSEIDSVTGGKSAERQAREQEDGA